MKLVNAEIIFSEEELEKLHAIDSLSGDIEDYKKFFSVFGVSLQNEDGTYKSMYDVFKEANQNYQKRYKEFNNG